jgi:DNA-binding MarR family transcriptional regulator
MIEGTKMTTRGVQVEDYRRLLALRVDLRRFLQWSEEQARAAGLTPSQHQLLLAVRGHHDRRGPTISEVADYLLLRHHSTVELAQRAEALGLLKRRPDTIDRRVVRLTLTSKGTDTLRKLSVRHLEELTRLGDHLRPLLDGGAGGIGLQPRTNDSS